jgi:glycosyltransferase involved in cell wall biosynthesis
MQNKRKVNIAVCGKFHLFNYMSLMLADINKFYFSARLSKANEFGVKGEALHNAWLKEYLIQGHRLILGEMLYEKFTPFYHHIWCRGVQMAWEPCELFHFISHGASLPLIKKAKVDGAKIIAEVVNTHPAHRFNIILEESEHWGVRQRKSKLFKREIKAIAEADQSDFILAPSRVVADSYAKHGISKKTYILPYVANTNRFLPKQQYDFMDEKIKLKILCVGSIGLRKGQLYLLEAIKDLHKYIELTLVGNIEESLLPHIKAYQGKFTHIERVAGNEMPDLMKSFDIYMLPSLEEGLALSISEAMSSGLTVIATKESGAEELISPNKNGILIDSRSIDQITESIVYLINNREMIKIFGEQAARDTAEGLNWDNYAARLSAIYKLILEQHKSL